MHRGPKQGGDDAGLGDDQDYDTGRIQWLKKLNRFGDYFRGYLDAPEKEVDTDVL